MAEVVYKNLEQMVSELAELEQQEIFTKEELRLEKFIFWKFIFKTYKHSKHYYTCYYIAIWLKIWMNEVDDTDSIIIHFIQFSKDCEK